MEKIVQPSPRMQQMIDDVLAFSGLRVIKEYFAVPT